MQLSTLINHPERLNRETLYELRSLVARYPYFQTARLLLLNNLYLLHEPEFGTELRRSVLFVADRRALCRLVEGYAVNLETVSRQGEEPTVDRTLSLIDAFLETLPKEQSALSLTVNAVGDYAAAYLLSGAEETEIVSADGANSAVSKTQEEKPSTQVSTQLKGQNLIDRFIEQGEERLVLPPASTELTPEPSSVDPLEENWPEKGLDERYFTETLAKIYIKQKKYSRALEIIRSLYLKYPEKNIYFADQIRFLEKLIININSK